MQGVAGAFQMIELGKDLLRFQEEANGLRGTVEVKQRRTQVDQRHAFAVAVADLAVQLQRAPVQLDGLLRSEEHTSELQSQSNLVCRLLLEKKKKTNIR